MSAPEALALRVARVRDRLVRGDYRHAGVAQAEADIRLLLAALHEEQAAHAATREAIRDTLHVGNGETVGEALARLLADKARIDFLSRLVWDPSTRDDETGARESIGDVTLFGTWGGCAIVVGANTTLADVVDSRDPLRAAIDVAAAVTTETHTARETA